jgi:hypothetical protein
MVGTPSASAALGDGGGAGGAGIGFGRGAGPKSGRRAAGPDALLRPPPPQRAEPKQQQQSGGLGLQGGLRGPSASVDSDSIRPPAKGLGLGLPPALPLSVRMHQGSSCPGEQL